MSIEGQTDLMVERRLYDVKGAAEYLRSIGATAATVSFVRTLIATGEVPHAKIGKAFYISKSALDLWLERRERRNRA